MEPASNVTAEVRRWILSGCRWKNNAFYNDPLMAITKGDTLLSYQFVFTDVLDCVFARGVYVHLRPTGRYKQSHSDESFSRNIYSPTSPENIPLHITNKYASTRTGLEMARKEWEYEKISRGYVIPAQEGSNSDHSINTTPIKQCSSARSHSDQDIDINFMTRECAFSFIRVWLSQIIHDSDLQSEKIALKILHTVAKLPRNIHDNEAYIQSIRNLIQIPVHTSSSTATVVTVLKNIFILLITRDIVQDLRYNWGCIDLYRLRLPIRYTISDGNMWENVFFPVIIASVPYLNFSRGSLAGIVALAEVLAHHVIAPCHQLATTLCTELVKRINTHSLGYETALRATRAALTRWAFEQNKSHVDTPTGTKKYDHGLDEPKEIVLPLLIRMRESMMSEFSPDISLLLSVSASAVATTDQVSDEHSRKRNRCDDNDDECEDEEANAMTDDTTDVVDFSQARKALRRSETKSRGKLESSVTEERDCIFNYEAMQKASDDARAVTSTPVGAMTMYDKINVLDDCISIIDRVLKKRVMDACDSKAEKTSSAEDNDDSGNTSDIENHDDAYIDMVSEILQDLQCLDLADGLKSKGVVAAAMEKACANMTVLKLSASSSQDTAQP
eukprot:CAMPEP_0114437510 /NCGR_PEP_ID=MMETSP0103-20121206/14054_1 /TAXON_ID=37642 ORGANISM="Paraphysomonas imperforata, Strain PA2" /NCGR_SAMPLE_ID=MMETSP0103 /ASSEMBLY_ACC=CAM_ASM_000201 /LENGTH=615 /DNA_ID=CAMNT_0001607911 /DNA_START=28 /DNA_END=1875 /DNA_ORIENTATION=+